MIIETGLEFAEDVGHWIKSSGNWSTFAGGDDRSDYIREDSLLPLSKPQKESTKILTETRLGASSVGIFRDS
jgi:hypothetical protein